jgi:hypothetical protein
MSATQLEVVLVELAPHLEAAADVEPAEVIHVIHAEGPAGGRGEERGRGVLSDPVVGDGMPAVEDLLVRCIEDLERRHHLAGGKGVDLDAALSELVHALGEDFEVLLERVARRPGGLHLDGLWRLGGGAQADQRGGCGNGDRTHSHGISLKCHPIVAGAA